MATRGEDTAQAWRANVYTQIPRRYINMLWIGVLEIVPRSTSFSVQ